MKNLTSLKTAAIVLFLMLGIALNAQDKNEFTTKVKELKGNVSKVTVNVDGKDVVFEGKDAEKLLEIVKPSAGKKIVMLSSDGDNDKIDAIASNGWSFHMNDDVDKEKGELKKKIQVEVKDGVKNVVVTTTDKDGKEEVKKYEGDEADKFLVEHGAENVKKVKHIKVMADGDNESDNMVFVSSNGMSSMNSCCCCCGGGNRMQIMHMPGGMKHKTIKFIDGDDDQDIVIKKKVVKKDVIKSEKKEVKKEEKK